jgi:hypothetical protein
VPNQAIRTIMVLLDGSILFLLIPYENDEAVDGGKGIVNCETWDVDGSPAGAKSAESAVKHSPVPATR